MEDYKEKLLKTLVDKFRNSKKDSGESMIRRRTAIDPTELYRQYRANDAELEEVLSVNEIVMECQSMGFVSYEKVKFGHEIKKVYLIDEQVEAVENYLKENYSYQSKREKIEYLRRIIRHYSEETPIASEECKNLEAELEKNKLPVNYEQKEDILKALKFIENNEKELYLREASMFIYGSSKYFEKNTLELVSKIIRTYLKQPCEEDEQVDEILQYYHIYKEEQKLCIKGNCTIYLSGYALETKYLKMGIEFSSRELEKIDKINVHADRFITVENKTTYNRYSGEQTVLFYLGGFTTRYQRDFLKLLYQDNSGKQYFHFGDIDAGGFFIHDHLCQVTGIPFLLLHMGIEELRDERYKDCLQELTNNDRKRLECLQDNVKYKVLVSYMLDQNVKLEQEIVGYYMTEIRGSG